MNENTPLEMYAKVILFMWYFIGIWYHLPKMINRSPDSGQELALSWLTLFLLVAVVCGQFVYSEIYLEVNQTDPSASQSPTMHILLGIEFIFIVALRFYMRMMGSDGEEPVLLPRSTLFMVLTFLLICLLFQVWMIMRLKSIDFTELGKEKCTWHCILFFFPFIPLLHLGLSMMVIFLSDWPPHILFLFVVSMLIFLMVVVRKGIGKPELPLMSSVLFIQFGYSIFGWGSLAIHGIQEVRLSIRTLIAAVLVSQVAIVGFERNWLIAEFKRETKG
ncbi:MAG: hypothetical protein D6732_22640 [Methanobacteriota archaeon]|nr:MAG: hypothetical protein D6732_22640 [Euryarchaeota archaeon]